MTDGWQTLSVDGRTVSNWKLVLPGKLQVLTDRFTGAPTAVVKVTVSVDGGAVTDGHLVLPGKLQVLTDGFTGVPTAVVKLTVSPERGTVTDGQLGLPRLLTVLTDGWTLVPVALVRLTVSADRGTVTRQITGTAEVTNSADGRMDIGTSGFGKTYGVSGQRDSDRLTTGTAEVTNSADGRMDRKMVGRTCVHGCALCLFDRLTTCDGWTDGVNTRFRFDNSGNRKQWTPCFKFTQNIFFAIAIDNLVFNSRDCFAIDNSCSCLINSCFSTKWLASANNAALFKDSLTRVDETVLLW